MHHNFKIINSQFANNLPNFGGAKELSQAIMTISDLYISKSQKLSTIWATESLTRAYLSYFLPLNLLRLKYVLAEAEHAGFLHNLKHLIDFGSGPGTFDIAANDTSHQFQSSTFIETGSCAIEWHKKLLSLMKLPLENKIWTPSFSGTVAAQSLVVFSYALNELKSLPTWAYNSEALLFLEPSTEHDGRNLQILRQELINNGYNIWAPCTHKNLCPLLEHSKTDWCHQRIHVELSPALVEIEKHLPIKNQSLTFSYLLARRDPPPPASRIRIIGDTQYERGKIKQAVCRGSKREFLTWLTRHGEPGILERGALIELPPDYEEKGNEIRLPNKFKD